MAKRFSIETVFKAIDRVTAPVSKMQQKVQRFSRSATRNVRQINRALSSTISGIKSFGGAIVKYGTVGVGAFAGSVGLLLREFSKVENAQAAFTPLMGGAEQAKKMVDALNDAASSTPFQFENLAGVANQLLPVMNGNIEDTIATMKMLGDTAGGNAQKLDSITRGFTKAMLKGKVDMESLNMIAEAGVPIFQDLADVMGMETGEKFFKMISAGKVSTDQLTKAFEKLTSEGGKFHKGMEIASQTTTGVWSTLLDEISRTAAEIGSVLAPTVKDLMKQAISVAKRVREWAQANREVINQKFLEFVDIAKRFVLGLIDAFNWLREHGDTVLKVAATIGALVVALQALGAALTIVNLIMMANPIGLIVLGVTAAIAAVSALIFWIDDLAGMFDGLAPAVRLFLAPLEMAVRAIKFIKDSFTGGFGEAARKLGVSLGLADDTEPSSAVAAPAVVTPAERSATLIEDRRQTSTAEVTIRDETARAEVTRGKLGPGLTLERSGGF